MPDYTLKNLEVTKDISGNPESKGGPAKVYTLTLEEEGGTVRYAEMFATAKTPLPNVGEKMKGEIDSSDTRWAPKWKPEGSQNRGGFRGGRSPGETKAIQRQHSQEMALRYHDSLVRAGHRPMALEQIHELTNWYEAEISGKQPPAGITIDPLRDDVPGDTADLEVKQSDGDAFP